MIKNIGILGVGGVGGYFGGKLCTLQNGAGAQKVFFVARGAHLKAIKEHGLSLKTENEGEMQCRPFLTTDSCQALPPLDLCLVCVKEFDLHELLVNLKNQIGEHTIILPLLNGVDVRGRIRKVIDQGIVLPACAYVGTHIEKPGVVSQNGGSCKILLGADPDFPDYDPKALLDLFAQSNILCEWKTDIESSLWEKFIFICSFGLVAAAFQKTIGEILEMEELRARVKSVAEEAVSISKLLGVPLPADIIQSTIRKGMNFPYETKPSFQRDFENPQKKDERDLFLGAMLNYAKDLNVAIPSTDNLQQILEKIKPAAKSP
ncbi:MAG: 2-dehydropantoate 2-reductase [SAR324 cluster bacterium]|nr:2-dehydropantoate 2-reductase [SAR324 cluster bacterium]